MTSRPQAQKLRSEPRVKSPTSGIRSERTSVGQIVVEAASTTPVRPATAPATATPRIRSAA